MTKISIGAKKHWSNYHKTINLPVEELAELVEETDDPSDPASYFRHTAGVLQMKLSKLGQEKKQLSAVGGAWSFNELLGSTQNILKMSGINGRFRVENEMIRTEADIPLNRLVLVGAGTCISALNLWLEEQGLSLRTSGAHDGQSIGGAISTGTHGSVLNYGGIQNHVRGIHVIGGPNQSYWLGPENQRILKDNFVREMGAVAKWDTDLFDASLVHLGGQGLINAYLLEVTELFKLELIQTKRKIDEATLSSLAAGRWQEVSASLGYDEEPYYYELIVDPFRLFDQPAIHRIYLKAEESVGSNIADHRAKNGDDDPVNIIGNAIVAHTPSDERDIPDWVRTLSPEIPSKKPDGTWERVFGTWGGLNAKHKPRGPLYNAAFAIDRQHLLVAIKEISCAVKNLEKHFVLTARFVKEAQGAMAFTRFSDAVVINLDGIGESESCVCPIAAEAAGKALRDAKIDYALHWGKLGGHNAEDIESTYGSKSDAKSPLGRWHLAREQIVPAEMRDVLVNDAIRKWKLV